MSITIITVTFQAEKILEKTIQSVVTQSLLPDEFIIVDGMSSDGTVSIIRRYEAQITRWISEPDSGIYNAMNKAVKMARGEWVLFMNAGDVFSSGTVLEKTRISLESAPETVQLVYGDCQMILPSGEVREDRALPPNQIYQRMVCSHQSLFSRRRALLQFPFEERYRVCADHHFVLRLIHSGAECVKLPYSVGTVQLENYTWDQIRSGHFEKWKAVKSVRKSMLIDVYFTVRLIRLALGSLWKLIRRKSKA